MLYKNYCNKKQLRHRPPSVELRFYEKGFSYEQFVLTFH